MRIRKICLCLAAAVSAIALFAPARAAAGEVLANSDIISLVRTGLPSDLIAAKIQSTPNSFDLSSRSMIALKENGVPDDIIKTMMAAAATSAARPGVDQAKFERELDNIASGGNARESGIAWMVSNREAVLPSLQRSLADPRPEIRSAAITVLGRLRDQSTLPAIRNLITDQSPLVRAATAQTLAEFDDTPTINAAEQAVARQINPMDGYIRLVGAARLTRAADSLGTVLSSNTDALNRIAAAWALGEIGRAGIAGRPALEKALASDTDPEVRREAAVALAKFHDINSATLLQNACRIDPQVRKVTLAAMAEYPETVEFLVGVMNLGADQIAADELETARNSLARLTGQDFGMDGARWSEWYAANRARFPSTPGAGSAAATAQTPSPAATSSQIPGGFDSFPSTFDTGDLTGQPAPRPREVDLEAWSIVADPNAIPMAPHAEMAPTAPSFSGGSLPIPPPGGLGGGGIPTSLSPSEISDSAAFSASGPAATAPAAGDQQNLFRTWSSEPDRPLPQRNEPSSTAASGPPSGVSGASFLPAGSGSDDSLFSSNLPTPESLEPEDAALFTSAQPEESAPGPESLQTTPAAPSVPPLMAPARADTTSLGGISLPLPGMEMGGMTSGTSESSASPDVSPFGETSATGDSFALTSPFAESGGSETDPFAAPPDFSLTDSSDLPFDDNIFAQPDSVQTADMQANPFGDHPSSSFIPGATDAIEDAAPDESFFNAGMTADPAAGPGLPVPATASDAHADEGLFGGSAGGFDPFAINAVSETTQETVQETVPDDPYAGMPIPGQAAAPLAAPDEPHLDFGLPAGLSLPPAGETAQTTLVEEEDGPIISTALDENEAPPPVEQSLAEPPAGASDGSHLFVEPEPGQLVVGDPLLNGVPAQSSTPGPYPAQPAAPVAPVAAPPVQPPATAAAEQGSGEDSGPLKLPAPGTPLVDTRFISIPGSEEETGRRRGAARSAEQTLEEIYRPYAGQVIPEPPPPPAPPQPPEQPHAGPDVGDVFSDPSVPLPPVRPEGTITPTRSGELPLLGDGMF